MQFKKTGNFASLVKLLGLLFTSVAVFAGTAVPNTFSPSTPAVAGQVNANFQALANAIDAQAKGNIKGQISACGTVTRSFVYVPGYSDMAYTASDGKFVLDNISAGTYSIVAEVAGESPVTTTGLIVSNGATTTSNIDLITPRVTSDVNNCGACGHVCGTAPPFSCVNSVCVISAYNLTTSLTTSTSATGTITSTPGGINCGATCSAPFNAGTVVTLTATPGSSYASFVAWGGACSGTGICAVTMDSVKSVTAQFESNYMLHLNVINGGSGGMVTASPSGGMTGCIGLCAPLYVANTTVTLTAIPNSGHAFMGWSGACSGPVPSCGVNMNTEISVTATFSP